MKSIYSKIYEAMIVPGYDLARNTSRVKYYHELDRTQWLPADEICKLQQSNLRRLIKHAYESVPYYRGIFKERNLSPDDIKQVEDLIKLPILTKREVNAYFQELNSLSTPRTELIPYQSGGSGDPLSFYITRESRSWELAAETRAYKWAGHNPGDPYYLLWGSPLDNRKKSLLDRIAQRLERVEVGDAWLLSDEALAGFSDFLSRKKIKKLRGYANAVYMLADFCQRNGIKLDLDTVITSAEKLVPERRKAIMDAFSCPVFDYYGSREIGAIAAECEEHQGYHISAENVCLEVIRDGEQASLGEEGALVLTNLRNMGMPFIRYEIGDVGKAGEDLCNCGRGLPLLASIEGRFSDFLSIYDRELGKVVPYMVGAPGFVGAALMEAPVTSYRVIQESLDHMIVQIVKADGFSDVHATLVEDQIRSFMKGNIVVDFEYLDSIPPLPSGKRSSFISKIKSYNAG